MEQTSENRNRDFLLIQLLNAFSKQELEGFKHFVACSYFNTDQFAIKLLHNLYKSVLNKAVFSSELQALVFSKVFTNKEKPKKILNVKQKSFLAAKMNVLLRLSETYLCNEAMKENVVCRMELLCDSLLEKNQLQFLKRKLVQFEKKSAIEKDKKVSYYAYKFKLEDSKVRFLQQSNLWLKEDNFTELNESIDFFYILYKLEIHRASMSIEKNHPQKKYDFDIMKSLNNLLSIENYANHPLLKLYLVSIELQSTNNKNKYYELVSLLDAYHKNISKTDLTAFYLIASNFCGMKIKEGEREYYQAMFKIYKKRDEKNLLIENGNIAISTLKNLITLGCKVEEYIWANEILEKYIFFTQKDVRDSIYNFNKGAISFYQNKYNEALSHFIKVDKVNNHYDIDCRMMILKTHYMLDKEYDERTIRIFLLSERFIKSQKKLKGKDIMAYKNFIRVLINTYKLKHNSGKAKKINLIKKIDSLRIISDKDWLIKMLNQLPE